MADRPIIIDDSRPIVDLDVHTGPPRPAILPGVILGIGLGGFLDGIVLHQIMRWHHMLSAVLPVTTMRDMEINMVFDGYFHAGVWVVTLLGIILLWSAGRRDLFLPSGRVFLGQLLFGWGLFNLIEGFIDHHLLQLHHVVDLPSHQPAFDWIFLALGGAGLLGLGTALMHPRVRRVAP